MVSSEASPWAKSGGLADVLGALPEALARLGHSVAVVIPRYMGARTAPSKCLVQTVPIVLEDRVWNVSIWELTEGDVRVFFVDQPALFDRPGLYGAGTGDFPDNHIRFAVLSRAAIEVIRRLFAADVIHCHDWQAGLVPAYLNDPRVVDPVRLGVRTLLTIHNLGYQGVFGREVLPSLGLPQDTDTASRMEFYGNISFLKAGIVFADALNTVSRRYAEEIQTPEYGFGMDGLLRGRASVLSGIVNGADYAHWSPETDPFIPARYSAAQVASGDLSGKQTCKRELLREMGLPEAAMSRPLIGIVSRFAGQKGFDLIGEAAPEMFQENISMVALGNGETQWEDMFRWLQSQFPDKAAVRFGYDERLAHRIEAGSDMFLMPSRYEPCGLNQLYSLRYGTVPVVRATGGLDDTITGAPDPDATGFKFVDYNGRALLSAVQQACTAWSGGNEWTAMMARGMRKDFSWTASAGEYSRLYQKIASSTGGNDSNSKTRN